MVVCPATDHRPGKAIIGTLPPETDQISKKRQITKRLVPILAYTCAIGSLVWVFHSFDYHLFEQDIRTLHWGWVAAGIILNLLVYLLEAWRWATLLRPAEIVPVSECAKAVFVGQVANAALPFKAGEIVRCYLLSFWTDTPLSLALTSYAISRVMDGICLAVGFYLVTIGLDVPEHLHERFAIWRDGAFILAIAVAVLSAVFLYVLFRREHATSFVSGNKWAKRFSHLMHEIHQLGDSKTLGQALAISVLYLALPMLSVWCLFQAYSFDFGLLSAGIVLVIIHMGTMVPNAPGNIGSFQFFATVALAIVEAEPSAAANFSVILYLALNIPQIAVGALVLLFTGLNLGEVHLHAQRAESSRHFPAS